MTNYTDRIQGVATNTAVKVPCRTITTANITLAGLQTIGAITLVAGDRVLVNAQTLTVYNGIWVAQSGDWYRALDMNGDRDIVQGTQVLVNSADGNNIYYLTTASPTIGTTGLAFSRWAVALSDLMDTAGFEGSLLQISVDGDIEPAEIVFEEATLNANLLTGTTVGHDAYLAATNFPDDNPGWVYTQNLMHSGTKAGNLTQFAINTITDTVAFRTKNNATWSDWQFIWTNKGIETFSPAIATGQFFLPINGRAGAAATLAGTADRIVLWPWVPTRDYSITEVNAIVTTFAVAGAAKHYIYESDENGKPDAWVKTSGEFDFSSNGVKTAACVYTFTKGTTYYQGLHTNGIATYNTHATGAMNDLPMSAMSANSSKTLVRSVPYASGPPALWVYDPAEATNTAAPILGYKGA